MEARSWYHADVSSIAIETGGGLWGAPTLRAFGDERVQGVGSARPPGSVSETLH